VAHTGRSHPLYDHLCGCHLAAETYRQPLRLIRHSSFPSFNKSTNLPAGRQVNKSTNQQINKSTNQQINKSTNQQINKSTNQQINKSTNQQIINRVYTGYRVINTEKLFE
jgi:hypothetical protein